jgi:hypothetical protein
MRGGSRFPSVRRQESRHVGERTRAIHAGDQESQPPEPGDRGARDRRALGDALAFCLLLARSTPPRFDRAIARWHARFVLDTPGITADEAALALSAAKGLAGLETRETSALTLRRLAAAYRDAVGTER